jgi:HUS1 checkpoint protein
MDFIFDGYHIQSAEAGNTINLELPLQPLQRALKSALNSISASLRLTKKDGLPVLSMTITTTTSATNPAGAAKPSGTATGDDPFDDDEMFQAEHLETSLRREHEKIITQDIPVRVLHPETVETIMQPRVREPDVHIQLPPLLQLKAISDRFTKLAMASNSGSSAHTKSPKLELSANMHGGLRLSVVCGLISKTQSLTPHSSIVPWRSIQVRSFEQAVPIIGRLYVSMVRTGAVSLVLVAWKAGSLPVLLTTMR